MGRSFENALEEVQEQYGPPGARRAQTESPQEWFARQYDSERYLLIANLLSAHCPAGGRVADVGAWPGTFSACLRRMGWRVVGVDKAINRTTDWQPSALFSDAWLQPGPTDSLSFDELCRREGVETVNADIESEALPFDSESIDAVVLTEVIEHTWRNPLFVLQEIHRVLKSNTGILVLTTPNLLSARHRIEFLRGRIDRVIEHPFVSFLKVERLGHLGHLRLYAPSEILDIVRLSGFSCDVQFQNLQNPYTKSHVSQPGALEGSGDGGRKKPGFVTRNLRRVFKTPREYVDAVHATLIEIAETRVPHLRGRITVVARKRPRIDLDKDNAASVKRLVLENKL